MSTDHLCDDAGVSRTAAYFVDYSDGVFHPSESAISLRGTVSLNGPTLVGPGSGDDIPTSRVC